MREAIVVTLATGRHAVPAVALLDHFVAAGNAALVVTDQPELFAGTTIETVPHVPDAKMVKVTHGKRHALRAGLERAWTAYFIDADHILRPGQRAPKLERLPAGVGSPFDRQVPALCNMRFPVSGKRPLSAPETAEVLDRAAAHLGVADWRALRWCGDWLYAVTRDEGDAWRAFPDAWDRLVELLAVMPVPNPMVLSDGVSLRLVAEACHWRVTPQVDAMTPIVRAFRHLRMSDPRMRGIRAAPC